MAKIAEHHVYAIRKDGYASEEEVWILIDTTHRNEPFSCRAPMYKCSLKDARFLFGIKGLRKEQRRNFILRSFSKKQYGGEK